MSTDFVKPSLRVESLHPPYGSHQAANALGVTGSAQMNATGRTVDTGRACSDHVDEREMTHLGDYVGIKGHWPSARRTSTSFRALHSRGGCLTVNPGLLNLPGLEVGAFLAVVILGLLELGRGGGGGASFIDRRRRAPRPLPRGRFLCLSIRLRCSLVLSVRPKAGSPLATVAVWRQQPADLLSVPNDPAEKEKRLEETHLNLPRAEYLLISRRLERWKVRLDAECQHVTHGFVPESENVGA